MISMKSSNNNLMIIVLSIHLSLLGLIGFDFLGIGIPIFRQLLGFLYLSFIPGYLIVKILKIGDLEPTETILYSVGLSISALMFIGFFLNLIPYIFTCSNPISLSSFIIVFTLLIIILMFFCYSRGIRSLDFDIVKAIDFLSPKVLVLILFPFLSIFGSQMVTYSQNSLLLYLLLPMISIVPILVCFNRIPSQIYPLLIFIISISLIYHTALVSRYIWGWDINNEYHLANLVLLNSFWDSSLNFDVNSMLSIVMLAPIYSIVLNMDLTWVFKIIYPFLFSLVPVGLYCVYGKKNEKIISFLACFFFISFEFFYFNAPTAGRQEIAELFLVLLLMLMVNNNIEKQKKSILEIIFLFSLAVSHYGTSYIYMFLLICSWLILRVQSFLFGIKSKNISYNYVVIFFVFSIAWYIYTSSSSPFNTITNVSHLLFSRIFSDLFEPTSSQGLETIFGEYSIMSTLELYIQLLFQFFIFIGVISLLRNLKKSRYLNHYIVFCFLSFGLDFAGIIVPHFSNQLNAPRLYHLTLIILAPIGIIGGINFINFIFNRFFYKYNLNSVKFMALLLTLFLLFNTTWIYSLLDEYPKSIRSISLYQKNINDGGDDSGINEFYTEYFLDPDVYSVRWLSKNRNVSKPIYADAAKRRLIFSSYGMMYSENVMTNNTVMKNDSYLYLGHSNLYYDVMYGPRLSAYWHLSDIDSTIYDLSLIYSSGTKIYMS